MPAPINLASYQYEEELMLQALASERGLEIEHETPGDAVQLVLRLNGLRKVQRQRSLTIYPAEDPRSGTSPYDSFIIRRAGSTVQILTPAARTASAKVREL